MESTAHDNTFFLESAPVPRAIVHMAVPMVMSMVLDLVYNMINAVFIGQLNDTAMLAAITLVFPFQIVLMGVGQVFGVGGGTLVARLLGEKNPGAVRVASSVNFYLSLASGLVVMALFLPWIGPLLSVLGASGPTLAPTRDMVVVLILGSPLLITTVTLAETLRGEGASQASMTGIVLSVVLNMALDPLLIFGAHLNVLGAALATVLANAAAVGYFVWYLRFKSPVQSVRWEDFRPTRTMVLGILSVGSAAFLFSTLMVVSALLFNTCAMGYGEAVVAAFGVANRLMQIVEFLGAGLFAGIVPLMAFSYAAGNHKRLGEVISTTALWFGGITVVLGLAMYLFQTPIFRLFSSDPEVLRIGSLVLTAMLVSVLFNGFTSVVSDMFQAFGAGLQANVMSLVRGLVLVPLLLAGNHWFGLLGLIGALPAAEIVSSLVGVGLWFDSSRAILSLPLEKRKDLVPAEG
jgi:putative MATE family efflux protein